jgi:REP element-mobilizing transposase RayT
MARRAQARQRTFGFGPRARGAGRPKSPDSGVSHLKRETVTRHTPVHPTLKLAAGLPSLRTKECYEVIWGAFEAGRERAGRRADGEFRLIEYSIQTDHIHLLVEAGDNDALARGICGLKTRLAKGLNRVWGRSGKVWKERYHCHVLRTPRELYNALRYVFGNGRKHGWRWNAGRPDPYSSALWFEGWRDYVHDGWVAVAGPIAKARSWLRNVGWRRHGLLSLAGP